MNYKLLTLALLFGATTLNAQEITFFTPSTVRVVKNAPDMSKETNLSLVVKATPEAVKVKKTTDGDVTT